MNYESYKQFFDGGFFPVDSTHNLVNLENTGEFSVKAILGSGADTKVVNHYLPSVQGLTNMLNNYTGGTKMESLQTHSNYFIPEIYDANSVAGCQKAIINYFEQRNKPIIINVNVAANTKIVFKPTYEDSDLYIDWGNGVKNYYHLKATYSVSHTYETAGTYKIKLWTNNEGVEVQGNTIQSIKVPYHCNILTSTTAYYGVTKVDEQIARAKLNVNSGATPYEGTEAIAFGDVDNAVNFNTGIADFCDLGDFVSTLTLIEIVAKNLYWDWKDLSFVNQLTIDVYPDDITAKTAIDYFAKQTYTAGKPILKILKGSGQEAIYQYAQTKKDKFSSISKEE